MAERTSGRRWSSPSATSSGRARDLRSTGFDVHRDDEEDPSSTSPSSSSRPTATARAARACAWSARRASSSTRRRRAAAASAHPSTLPSRPPPARASAQGRFFFRGAGTAGGARRGLGDAAAGGTVRSGGGRRRRACRASDQSRATCPSEAAACPGRHGAGAWPSAARELALQSGMDDLESMDPLSAARARGSGWLSGVRAHVDGAGDAAGAMGMTEADGGAGAAASTRAPRGITKRKVGNLRHEMGLIV